jgi:uncharacterized protein YjbI with pentapeptide repeats
VSTIWISFLIFSLYLLVAATTVEHRQILLAEPVKLPVLNIDLPLWGFFVLAPILFVIFHAYVLLQVLLLGRTAAAYNVAVDRAIRAPPSNDAMRQRLANTLFAQIFAGSPRERHGWLGVLLKAMAWITLAIAPILILLAFQFAFLPYHSHLATWTHRLLILIEMATVLLLWPLVLDAQRDLVGSELGHGTRRLRILLAALTSYLAWPLVNRGKWAMASRKRHRQRAIRRASRLVFPILACLLLVLLSFSWATFPGEPHVNLFTGQSLSSVQCERWFHQKFNYVDLRFDRLDLPRIDVVDDEKLAKIVQATAGRKLRAYEGERTRNNFRDRDFNCADFSNADFRRVDLTGARLSGAALDFVAQLQGASLYSADLQGASLDGAKLQGAALVSVSLQGASLDDATLHGASLSFAKLQGATLSRTNLQGASLDSASLQGAALADADLTGASFVKAMLQGATLYGSKMNRADLSGVYIWGARGAACRDARVSNHKADAIVDFQNNEAGGDTPVPAIQGEIEKFIERSTADIPDATIRGRASVLMKSNLAVDATKDGLPDIVWRDCEEASKNARDDEFQGGRARLLRDLVCTAKDDREAIANGTVRNWFQDDQVPGLFAALLARDLITSTVNDCPALKHLNASARQRLRAAMAPAAIVPSANQTPPTDPPQ